MNVSKKKKKKGLALQGQTCTQTLGNTNHVKLVQPANASDSLPVFPDNQRRHQQIRLAPVR